MLKKEEIEKVNKINGQIRGVAFQTDAEYIINRFGIEGLNRLKEELGKLGFNLDYKDVRAMDWFPLSLRVLSFLVIKDIFDFEDNDFLDMGNSAPKYSFLFKLLMKFFVTPRTAFDHSPDYWKKHYSVGRLEAFEFNEEGGYGIVRIFDFIINPIYCKYLEGYFQRLFAFMFPDREVLIKETKCTYRGEKFHEFKADWGING